MSQPKCRIWLVATGAWSDHEPVAVFSAALMGAGHTCKVFGTGNMEGLFRDRGVPFEPNDAPVVFHQKHAEAREWLSKQAEDAGMSGPDKEEDFLIALHLLETEYLWHSPMSSEDCLKVRRQPTDCSKRYTDLFVRRAGYTVLNMSAVKERRQLCVERQAKEMGISVEESKELRETSLRSYCEFLRTVAHEHKLDALAVSMALYKAWEMSMTIDDCTPTRVSSFFAWLRGEGMRGYWEHWSEELQPLKSTSYCQKGALGLETRSDHIVMQNMILTLDALPPEEMPHLVICAFTLPSLLYELQVRRKIRTLHFWLHGPPMLRLDDAAAHFSVLKNSDLESESGEPTALDQLGPFGFSEMASSPQQLLGISVLTLLGNMPPSLRTGAGRLKDLMACFTGPWESRSDEPARPLGERERLAEFLVASADRPVCMVWEGLPADAMYGGRRRLAELAVGALRLAGMRGIFIAGWSGVAKDMVEDAAGEEKQRVLWVQAAPYEWLFLQCACSVQHGTAAIQAAVRAGLPTVVVPSDQFRNSDWVANAGFGLRTKPLRELTAEELGNAVKTVVQDELIKARCRDAQATMESEPGVAGAVQLVNKFIQGSQLLIPSYTMSSDLASRSYPWKDGRYAVYHNANRTTTQLVYRGGAVFQNGKQVGWLRPGAFDEEVKVSRLLVESCGYFPVTGTYQQRSPHLYTHEARPGVRIWFVNQEQCWFMGAPGCHNGKSIYKAVGHGGCPPSAGWSKGSDLFGLEPMPVVADVAVHRDLDTITLLHAGMAEVNGIFHRKGKLNWDHVSRPGARIWFYPQGSRWFIGVPEKFGGKAAYNAKGTEDGMPSTGWNVVAEGGGRDPTPQVLSRPIPSRLIVAGGSCEELRGSYFKPDRLPWVTTYCKEHDVLEPFIYCKENSTCGPSMWFAPEQGIWCLGERAGNATYSAPGVSAMPPQLGWKLTDTGCSGAGPMLMVSQLQSTGLAAVEDRARTLDDSNPKDTFTVQGIFITDRCLVYGKVSKDGEMVCYPGHNHHFWEGEA